MTSSTASSAVRFTSSITGFTSTTSMDVIWPLSHTVSMARCASRYVMPPRTGVPTPGASYGIDRVHIEGKMKSRGARGGVADRFLHHAAQAAFVDIAHGEAMHAGARARSAARFRRRCAARRSRRSPGRPSARSRRYASAPAAPGRSGRRAACRARCRWGSISGVFISACASIQIRPSFLVLLAKMRATCPRRFPSRPNDRRRAPAARGRSSAAFSTISRQRVRRCARSAEDSARWPDRRADSPADRP